MYKAYTIRQQQQQQRKKKIKFQYSREQAQ